MSRSSGRRIRVAGAPRRPSKALDKTFSGRPPMLEDDDSERALLVRVDGSNGGEVFTLAAKRIVVGRHPASALRVEEMGVSREHARISVSRGKYWIEDLGSHNGTYVSGKKVQKAQLTVGDLVQLGPHAAFRFTVTTATHEQFLRQLYEFSTRDAVTGISNRRHFEERLQAELAFAVRHDTGLGLLLLDIDHFKRINDAHGHVSGDQVLAQVARRLEAPLRSGDLEEFAVLLRAVDLSGCEKAGERLRAAVAAGPCTVDAKDIDVTVSGGAACLVECTEATATALIRVADHRLYAAKRAGRNRVVGA